MFSYRTKRKLHLTDMFIDQDAHHKHGYNLPKSVEAHSLINIMSLQKKQIYMYNQKQLQELYIHNQYKKIHIKVLPLLH